MISVGRSGGDFETRSGGISHVLRCGFLGREVLASRTWTSFSPSETRFTIFARATLSGLGSFRYSVSRIAWSSGLYPTGHAG